MVLEAALELRIGRRVNQLRKRLEDLIFGVVDILEAVEEEVVKRRNIFAEQAHGALHRLVDAKCFGQSRGSLSVVRGLQSRAWR